MLQGEGGPSGPKGLRGEHGARVCSASTFFGRMYNTKYGLLAGRGMGKVSFAYLFLRQFNLISRVGLRNPV